MRETDIEYYFVPLGRERGGLLECLGLPPDADMQAIGNKRDEYRIRLETEYKDKRKPLKQKRDAKEITLEEYNAADELLKAVWTKGEADLNELWSKHEQVLGEARKAAHQGRPAEAAVWVDLFAECCAGAARLSDCYFALLGLPGDANETRANQADRKFRENLALEFKQKQRQLRDRLKNKEIAQDVFDAGNSAIQAARQKNLAELDEAKQHHEQADGWREAAVHDGEQLWSALLNLRDLPQIAPEWITEISDRWLRHAKAGDTVEESHPDARCLDLLADVTMITDTELRQRLAWLERIQKRELARLEVELLAQVREQKLTRADAKTEFAEQKNRCAAERKLFVKRAKERRQANQLEGTAQTAAKACNDLQLRGRQRFFAQDGPDLSTLVDLIDQQNLLHLLVADSL